MHTGRDYKGTFTPGPEAAKNGAKGGAVKTKRKGFGADPEKARLAQLKSVETRRLNRERTRRLQDMGIRGSENERAADASQEPDGAA